MTDCDRFLNLMEKYLDGQLTIVERHAFRKMLAQDPACRQHYVEVLHQEATLRTLVRKASTKPVPMVPKPTTVSWSWGRWAVGMAAAIVLAIGVWYWVIGQPVAAHQIVRLEQVQGEVYVLSANSRAPAKVGQSLRSGQGIQVVGEDSLAIMIFPDSTRVELGAGTVIAERSGPGQRLLLPDECFVFADVTEQPSGQPLTIATALAEIKVQSGRLSLANASAATRIDVNGGAPVQVVRKSDGQSVEVKTGHTIRVASSDDAIVSTPLSPRLPAAHTTLKDHDNYIAGVAFSSDGRFLAVGQGDGTVKLWDLATRTELATLGKPSTRVRVLAFSPDNRRLAVGLNGGVVQVWDLQNSSLVFDLEAHTNQVYAVSFSADGTVLLTAGKDGFVILWELATSRERLRLTGCVRSSRSATFSADNSLLATGDWNNTLRLWAIPSGKAMATLRLPQPQQGGIFALAFTSDHELLAAGSSDGTVQLWNTRTHQNVAILPGHQGKVECLAFSPDGKILATGGRDHMVRFWDVSLGQEIAAIEGDKHSFSVLTFSRDGRSLAAASGGRSVGLWNAPRR